MDGKRWNWTVGIWIAGGGQVVLVWGSLEEAERHEASTRRAEASAKIREELRIPLVTSHQHDG